MAQATKGELGRITRFGPAHYVEALPTGLYIISSETGINCWAGNRGAVLFATKESAVEVFRALTGKEPITKEIDMAKGYGTKKKSGKGGKKGC